MKRVFVGLSGGVDSAVSAALLKEQGYDVTGVFIKIWQPEFLECTWKEDRLDAMRVSAALGIPFREIDLSAEYKKNVVADMLAKYAEGVTPNPDVLCNSQIKFGVFFDWALAQGAEYIATGHYAQVEKTEKGFNLLLRGRDPNKDQSYFLWELKASVLEHVLFPVGVYTKPEVRALAKKFYLPNAKRPDSQGLCFVGDVSMEEFLKRFLAIEEGNVVDSRGHIIGRHQGAALYTIGQRHGYEVHEENVPHYVIGLDVRKNEIAVSAEKSDAARTLFHLHDIHWITPRELPLTCTAQVRYRDLARTCTISKTKDAYSAEFEEAVIASAGQSLVLYEDEVCLGGGIITS